MEKILIKAKLNDYKRTEFYHTFESLSSLIKGSCESFDLNISDDNMVLIQLSFNNVEEFNANFKKSEFDILKGALKSLCQDITITNEAGLMV